MRDVLTAVLLILGPTYLCCAIALAWSAWSASPTLARMLKASGLFWAAWLTLAFAVLAYLPAICSGNALYGFTQCRTISDPVASLLNGFGLLSFLAGIAAGGLLLVIGGIVEALVRRPRP
jgi:hypothetical protein